MPASPPRLRPTHLITRSSANAQIHGTAHRVTDLDERGRLLALLVQRYSFLAKPKDAPAKMASAFDSAAVYRLEPARVVLIDNSLGFGHKDTLALSD